MDPPLPASSAPPPLIKPPAQLAYARQAVIFSLIAPFAAMVLYGGSYREDASRLHVLVGPPIAGMIVLASFGLAIFALWQGRKHGSKRVFYKALVGVCFNGILVALAANYYLTAPNAIQQAKHRHPLSASQEVGPGTFASSVYQNTVYRNKYLGFSITLPGNWSVQDGEDQRDLLDDYWSELLENGETTETAYKVADYETATLFAAYQKPPDRSPEFGTGIMAMAIRVGDMPQFERGSDCLHSARKTIQSWGIQIPSKDFSAINLNGIDFDVMEFEFRYDGTTFKRSVYVALRKGYALTFVSSYATQDEARIVRSILRSLDFHEDGVRH